MIHISIFCFLGSGVEFLCPPIIPPLALDGTRMESLAGANTWNGLGINNRGLSDTHRPYSSRQATLTHAYLSNTLKEQNPLYFWFQEAEYRGDFE